MNTASEAQVNFIQKLLGERDTTGQEAQTALGIANKLTEMGEFSKAAASEVIDLLLDQPRLEIKTVSPAREGMHKVGDDIYKVQRAVHGSGHLYAKKLVVWESEFGHEAKFEYAPGAIKLLSEATRMSLDEAKAFGALYGTCCVCGRTLTNEASIEAGIGPICAGQF